VARWRGAEFLSIDRAPLLFAEQRRVVAFELKLLKADSVSKPRICIGSRAFPWYDERRQIGLRASARGLADGIHRPSLTGLVSACYHEIAWVDVLFFRIAMNMGTSYFGTASHRRQKDADECLPDRSSTHNPS
jgi:hypothetical protein